VTKRLIGSGCFLGDEWGQSRDEYVRWGWWSSRGKGSFGSEFGLCHGNQWGLFCVVVREWLVTSAEEGGYVFGSVCLSVCLSDYSQTCERILTKFFVGVGHGSRTKFGGDPDHALDPGVQSPKSGSSGLPCSAEVCALWVLLVLPKLLLGGLVYYVMPLLQYGTHAIQDRRATWLRRRNCSSHCCRRSTIRSIHAPSRNSFRKVPNFCRCLRKSIASQWLHLSQRQFLLTFPGKRLCTHYCCAILQSVYQSVAMKTKNVVIFVDELKSFLFHMSFHSSSILPCTLWLFVVYCSCTGWLLSVTVTHACPLLWLFGLHIVLVVTSVVCHLSVLHQISKTKRDRRKISSLL